MHVKQKATKSNKMCKTVQKHAKCKQNNANETKKYKKRKPEETQL